jgi:hypothetical protein
MHDAPQRHCMVMSVRLRHHPLLHIPSRLIQYLVCQGPAAQAHAQRVAGVRATVLTARHVWSSLGCSYGADLHTSSGHLDTLATMTRSLSCLCLVWRWCFDVSEPMKSL